ncbi:NUCLEOTIDE-BINDING ALPHA-BETA PLAIT DOMAIN-CONTAINING PROTEIN-RELATED [Salix purpurea]|uniref:NUCLEOTIDE-BINDING ALPHA-BETA PLAIT DOMAIN-CONTAINING PROTEIN-RELATED n=1 Tax=Salix purpurea TaxID=77065 RepID=A0A9Q0NZV6_SALPP|nr:NUCLEOTIDE-BINDING ALPHA-BETA PLAIT DOMAIN-CONTAINING PROTEIN-RELATED [Salix purpurea]
MDVEERKLFVGGIPRGTSEDNLRDHFSKYGVVSYLLVAKDQITKLPRGFAFVAFSDAASAARALEDSHVILGRTVEVKKAIPRTEKHQVHRQRHPHGNLETTSNGLGMNSDNSTGNENCYRTKKIFVGGLSSNLTDEQFRNYFEKFGRTTDAIVMQDSLKNPRGFGFVTFDSEESVAKVMRNSFHELNGKTVEVKKAVRKDRVNGDIGSWSSNGFSDNGPGPKNHPIHGPTYDPHYTPFPMYDGVHGYFYGMSLYGGVYPMLGFGRPVLAVSPMVPSIPFMPAAGMYPYSNACLYPTYMHDASSIWGMEVVGHNQIVEPGVNGEVDVVHDSNVHFPSNATAPPSEEGNVGSESFGLNGGDVDVVHDSNGRVVPGINGEEVGHNQTVEPGVNGEVDAVHGSNEHVPSNATAPPSEESKVGSDALGLKSGDVDAVPDSNRRETGVNGELDAVHDSNGHVPSNAKAPPSEEGKVGSDAFGVKGGDVDVVPDINGHFEPDVNGEEVGGYNQIVEPDVNGEEVGCYNQIVETGVNGEVYAFCESNGHVPSNATAPPSEEGKVGSGALGFTR